MEQTLKGRVLRAFLYKGQRIEVSDEVVTFPRLMALELNAAHKFEILTDAEAKQAEAKAKAEADEAKAKADAEAKAEKAKADKSKGGSNAG